MLINFVKKGKLSEVIQKAIDVIEELDPAARINVVDEKNFVSSHKEYGIIFHHFVDLIESAEQKKK